MQTLAEKVAIVTGGAGALGLAVVAALIEAGATVAVPSHYAEDAPRLRQRAGLDVDAPLIVVTLDLTDVAAVERAYNDLAARLGGLDILVNVAGGFAGGRPVHQTSWDVWQEQFDLNVKTAVASCRAAIPHLIARGGGAIVNVSSRTAMQAGAKLAAYAAAKRSILQLTEALAEELREHDITANAILPSVIDTPSNRAAMPNADHNRWVAPAAIARVVCFLVGPDARIISGAAVPVYGRA